MTIGKITNLLTFNGNKGKGRRIFSDSLHFFNNEIHKNFSIQGGKLKEPPLPIFNKIKSGENIFDKKRCSFLGWGGLSGHLTYPSPVLTIANATPLVTSKESKSAVGTGVGKGVTSLEVTKEVRKVPPLLESPLTPNEKVLPGSFRKPPLFPQKNLSFIELGGGLKLEIWKRGGNPLQILISTPPAIKKGGGVTPLREGSSLVNRSSSNYPFPVERPLQKGGLKGLHRKRGLSPTNGVTHPDPLRGTGWVRTATSGEVFVWKGLKEKVSLMKGVNLPVLATPTAQVLPSPVPPRGEVTKGVTPKGVTRTGVVTSPFSPKGATSKEVGTGEVRGVKTTEIVNLETSVSRIEKGKKRIKIPFAVLTPVRGLVRSGEKGGSFFGALPSKGGREEEKLSSSVQKAVENCRPTLEVRNKKIAGTTRQIPALVPRRRGERLAVQWILSSAEKRREGSKKKFSTCFSEELLEAFYHRGDPKSRRDSLHKTAEANRSFLRYRWW
jgi:small subunit ribosomal protein S7